MRKILLTGGSGFIAKEIANFLSDKNDLKIYVLHREENSFTQRIKACTNLYCDIRDHKSLNSTLEKIEFDYVIHLAAQSGNLKSNLSSKVTLETNIQGTLNLLEACTKKSIKGFILASSSIVYELSEEKPIKESFKLHGKNAYAISKISSETIAKHYSEAYQIPLIICRLGMVFGGGDNNMDRLVPYIINCLISKKEIYIRSSKEIILDPIYVCEAAEGIVKMLSYFDNHEKVNEIFNLSSGNPIKMKDFVGKILATSGIKGIIPRYGDSSATTQLLSIEKFKNKIGTLKGYVMDEALKETLSWYKQNTVKSKDV